MESDTLQLLTEGEEVVNMTHSRGWGIVHKKFSDKILDLQLIGNITGATAIERDTNREARMMAATLLFEVLREVAGIVENHQLAKDAEKTDQDTTLIERL